MDTTILRTLWRYTNVVLLYYYYYYYYTFQMIFSATCHVHDVRPSVRPWIVSATKSENRHDTIGQCRLATCIAKPTRTTNSTLSKTIGYGEMWFCTSAVIISASSGSHVALSQHPGVYEIVLLTFHGDKQLVTILYLGKIAIFNDVYFVNSNVRVDN